jgi:ABC-type antimicrobial peptide transport system permease subunit
MHDFWLWFSIGLQHILDLSGYDHICYIVALTVVFPISEWRKLLVLITAFTIGHSLTLALSTLNIISPKQELIECLIPLTILATCIYNIIMRKKPLKTVTLNYFFAFSFGLIHGMGFSYLLKSLLGREESIIGPLFSFNIGLEIGQLIIVSAVLLISVILNAVIRMKKEHVILAVSSLVLTISLFLLTQRINEFLYGE